MRKEKQFKSNTYTDPEANVFGRSSQPSSSSDASLNVLPWDVSQDSYCFKCSRVKPARAHHCKQCKKFVCFNFKIISFKLIDVFFEWITIVFGLGIV
jgi:hypothetical protein